MGLQQRTIQKLLRETFPGATPLVVAASERKKLGANLKASLERIEGVDTKEYVWARDEDKPRLICSFSIHDPDSNYYYRHDRFLLLADDVGRLTIKQPNSDDSALVSDVDEVIRFVQHCMERLNRHKALRAKRGKVRGLLAQAILAQVRKLAKEEHFDYMSETDAQKLKLYVKLSPEQAAMLRIPLKEFKQFLPQLRSTIATLRKLHACGIRFRMVSRQGLPRRTSWITHESL